MEDIINDLNKVYERLQTLDILPTLANMEKLLQSLYDMKEIARKLKEGATDGGTGNGQTDNPG